MKPAVGIAAAALIGGLQFGAAGAASAADQGDIVSKGTLKWDDLLTDNAAGAVTAAAFLDIGGDVVRPVENVRDVVVSLKGLDANGDKATLGLSITPARTRLMTPQLSAYKDSWGYRFLSATTLSYAQGKATLEGRSYDRRAVAIDSGFYLRDEDDPVLALAKMDTRGQCPLFDNGAPVKDLVAEARARGELPTSPPPAAPRASMPATAPATPTAAAPAAASPPAAPAIAPPTSGAQVPAQAPAAEAARQRAASAACRDTMTRSLRWNRSYVSASLATGWGKPGDGGTQHRLGTTAMLGLTYGFDHLASLRERALLTVAWRRTRDEPILSTWDTGVQTRDTSLTVVRLSGGSTTIRALLEASNAKSDGGTTASQRAFTRALGLDLRVQEGLWVGLRFGRQQKIDGSGTEVGSLLSVSYSPTSLLTP